MAAFLKKFRNKSKSEETSGFAEDELSKKDERRESPVSERGRCFTYIFSGKQEGTRKSPNKH